MPRRPATVTQATIARVLRAVRDAGLPARVEVRTDGTIVVETGPAGDSAGPGKVVKFERKREIRLW